MNQENITLERIYLELKRLEATLQEKGIIKEKDLEDLSETALLSERSLAKEWLSPEEDEAWRDL